MEKQLKKVRETFRFFAEAVERTNSEGKTYMQFIPRNGYAPVNTAFDPERVTGFNGPGFYFVEANVQRNRETNEIRLSNGDNAEPLYNFSCEPVSLMKKIAAIKDMNDIVPGLNGVTIVSAYGPTPEQAVSNAVAKQDAKAEAEVPAEDGESF